LKLATPFRPFRDDAAGPELETGQQTLEEALRCRGIPPVLRQEVEHEAAWTDMRAASQNAFAQIQEGWANALKPNLNSAEAQLIGIVQEIEKICALWCHALEVR
jgi:hypothetical protein